MIRPATIDDLEDIVTMRCAMWTEHHPDDPSDSSFEAEVRAYYALALGEARERVWVAVESGACIGMVTVLVQLHPPRKGRREVRGYVTAVFVKPHARRKGHARSLMEAVIAHAKAEGTRRLTLRTTDLARTLYTSVGFRPLEHLAIDL